MGNEPFCNLIIAYFSNIRCLEVVGILNILCMKYKTSIFLHFCPVS